jgi:hypothetical protein
LPLGHHTHTTEPDIEIPVTEILDRIFIEIPGTEILGRIFIDIYQGAWTFRSIFAIVTKPPTLDISAPFAISGLPIKTEKLFDFTIKSQAPPGVLVTFLIVR